MDPNVFMFVILLAAFTIALPIWAIAYQLTKKH